MKLRDLAILVFPMLVISGLGWFFVVEPSVARHDDAVRSLHKLDKTITRLQSKLEEDQATQKKIRIDPQDLWGKKKGSAQREMQTHIVELADSAGISMQRFGAIQSPTDTTGVAEFDLELTGSLNELAQFLTNIETSRPRLAIGSIIIRPDSTAPSVDGETQIGARLLLWGISNDALQ